MVASSIDFSYNTVLNALPRHLIALLAALFIGILISFTRIKIFTKRKIFAIKVYFSTSIGEATLQIIGTTVAWVGTLNFTTQILPFVTFFFSLQGCFEAFLTPINMYISRWLKDAKDIDSYGI